MKTIRIGVEKSAQTGLVKFVIQFNGDTHIEITPEALVAAIEEIGKAVRGSK